MSEDTKKKISLSNIGRICTDEQREKISKSITEMYLSGKFNFGTGRYYSKKNECLLFYRSSYEKIAYKILDNDKDVDSFDTEPFFIRYKYGGINRRYIPDLLVNYKDGNKSLIEIKPKALLKNNRVVAKIRAAEIYCNKNDMEFIIWTEDNLEINKEYEALTNV